MEQQPNTPSSENSQEKIVQALKFTTVFNDLKVLEKIADTLLSEGTISGYRTYKSSGAYLKDGEKVKEGQYSLDILLEASVAEDQKQKVRDAITETIGKVWDAPVIQEEVIPINEKYLHFIERAKIEHAKYLSERKKRLTAVLASLLSLATAVGVVGKKYVDDEKQKVVDVERKRAHDRVQALHDKIQDKITDMNVQIEKGIPFTPSPTDMAAGTLYKEPYEILYLVREAENEMRRLEKGETK